MLLIVREVRGADERRAVSRLRYDVYVEEMGRHEPSADWRRRSLEDGFDDTGRLFAAFDGWNVVGTARVNLARDTDLGPYEDWYGMRSAVA